MIRKKKRKSFLHAYTASKQIMIPKIVSVYTCARNVVRKALAFIGDAIINRVIIIQIQIQILNWLVLLKRMFLVLVVAVATVIIDDYKMKENSPSLIVILIVEN